MLVKLTSTNTLDFTSKKPSQKTSAKPVTLYYWHKEPKQRHTASNLYKKISQLIGQIPKYDTENLTSSVPHLSGSIPDPVITIQEVPKTNLIVLGSTPNRLITDNQLVQNNEESEIERKI